MFVIFPELVCAAVPRCLSSAGSAVRGARCSFIVLRLAQFCRCKQQAPPLESGLHLEGEGDGRTLRTPCVGELALSVRSELCDFQPFLGCAALRGRFSVFALKLPALIQGRVPPLTSPGAS